MRSAEKTFRKGSRSFSLAALFFDRDTYEDATLLYAWCRHCDDEVDSLTGESVGSLLAKVQQLEEKTRRACAGEEMAEEPFRSFGALVRKHQIPLSYPLELLEGMAMDARCVEYETLADLEIYAYRVAGTVGLMMSRILGVSDPRAERHAMRLGIAMQLTNISRDVREDAGLGRVYLPLSWLRRAGVEPEALGDPRAWPRVAPVVRELVEAAEAAYEEGNQGLRYLPARAALAIAAASGIYRAIGHRVVKRGGRAWETRTVVPLPRKLWEMAAAPLRIRSAV